MTFRLKNYQTHILAQLAEFFRLAKVQEDVAAAYKAVVASEGGKNPYASRYQPLLPEWKDRPHVCVRVPTAGGKTVTAANAIKIAADFMETETPTVLWFAPTVAIAEQTLDALKNRRHPCRLALEDSFGKGPQQIAVADISDYDILPPDYYTDKVCIIVSTAAMFRVKQTERGEQMTKATRQIYASKEDFDSHFDKFLPPHPPPGLERDADGEIKTSFVNLLHLLRPLVVLDEAHNFVSELSQEVLGRINPSCILEWTATPREKSPRQGVKGKPLHNVLLSVSAETLQEEEMVKLPIEVAEHLDDWRLAVAGAVKERQALADITQQEKEPIRPIALYQAHDKNGEAPPLILKKHLIESENIAAEKIAIATGDTKELKNINLLASDCPIEHIITVDALREGWDCPFAYVLCSVANLQSAVAIEQLLGRVMRMPFAQRRRREELNRAYAHVLGDNNNISMAAETLGRRLADNMGFEEEEIRHILQYKLNGDWDENGLFHPIGAAVFITAKQPDFSRLNEEERQDVDQSIAVRKSEAGGCEVELRGPIPQAAQQAIIAATAPSQQEKTKIRLRRENIRLSWEESPASKGEKFSPLPLFKFYSPEEKRNVVANGASLHEVAEWNMLGDCLLGNFESEDTAHFFRISLEKKKLQVSRNEGQTSPLFRQKSMSAERLTAWLEREIYYKDGRYFSHTLKDFAHRNVQHLLSQGSSLQDLSDAKYQLAEALRQWLKAHTDRVSHDVLRQYILGGTPQVECSFVLPPARYDVGEKPYDGRYRFKRHYYHQVGALDSQEELTCAKVLDCAEHILYWIRNLPNKPHSYSLPRGGGRDFFPDFMAQLDDGRVLVVEYKGGVFLDTEDSKTKNAIGEKMEEMANGKCFFLMPSQAKEESIAMQIKKKIQSIKKQKL